jgi:hypothetical protein
MASRVVRGRFFASLVVLVISMLGLALWFWSALVTIAPRSGPADLLALIDEAAPPPGSVAEKIRGGARVTLLLLARGGGQAEDPNLTDTILSETATIATSPMVRLRLGTDNCRALLSIQGIDAKRADLVPRPNPSLRKST